MAWKKESYAFICFVFGGDDEMIKKNISSKELELKKLSDEELIKKAEESLEELRKLLFL